MVWTEKLAHVPQIHCTMEIKRDSYLNQLVNARQNGFIKVVTGPRRCGKSYLLKTLFHNHLLLVACRREIYQIDSKFIIIILFNLR